MRLSTGQFAACEGGRIKLPHAGSMGADLWFASIEEAEKYAVDEAAKQAAITAAYDRNRREDATLGNRQSSIAVGAQYYAYGDALARAGVVGRTAWPSSQLLLRGAIISAVASVIAESRRGPESACAGTRITRVGPGLAQTEFGGPR